MTRSHSLLGLVTALLSLLLVAGDVPRTRTIEIKWTHPGEVAGFKVYTRLYGQEWGDPIDVGLPPKKDGAFVYQLEVSNYDATYVTVSAYDAQRQEGGKSNERLYLLPDPKTEPD